MSVESSVTWLFVPGARPERFDKAASSGADEVILDLEDAVEVAAKAQARDHVRRWCRDAGGAGAAWVRVNGAATGWFQDDLAALAEAGAGVRGVIVPKADAAAVSRVADLTALPILALVETAIGLRQLDAVVAHPQVVRTALGSVDLAVDLGSTAEDVLDHARIELIVASRAGDLPAPLDGVTTEVADAGRVRGDAARARALGFGGKLCIHPAQLASVGDGFRPSEVELAWAERIVAAGALAEGAGAFRVDGRMVDKPVSTRAERLLALARGTREESR